MYRPSHFRTFRPEMTTHISAPFGMLSLQKFLSETTFQEKHDYYAIVRVQNTCGTYHIDFKDYDIEPDSIFFIAPDQVHWPEIDDEEEGSILYFTSDFFAHSHDLQKIISDSDLFLDLPNQKQALLLSQEGEIRQHVDWHWSVLAKASALAKTESSEEDLTEKQENTEEDCSQQQDKQIVLRASLSLLLLQFKQLLQLSKIKNSDPKLSKFKHLLEENYQSKHSVQDYADMVNTPPDEFNQRIYRQTGHDADYHIQHRLMLQAKRLAYRSKLSPKEISPLLGFCDEDGFSQFFQEHMRTSFDDFRSVIRSTYQKMTNRHTQSG